MIVNGTARGTAERRPRLRLPTVAFEPLVSGDTSSAPASASSLWWLALLASSLVIVAPLLVTEIPPLLDYPNHLARMEVLAHGAGDPFLSRMYATQWRILPNIAMDAIVPAMLDLMPLYVAGRCIIALALLLPFLGSVFLHVSLFHRRSFWPLSAALVVYNELLFVGFLNFLIGLGLALVGAAIWVRTLRRPIARLATAFLFGMVIFFCHLIALAIYGFLIFALEVAMATEVRPGVRPIRLPHPARLIGMALPFVIPAVLYLHAPLVGERAQLYWGPLLKVEGVFAGFTTYSLVLDGAALLFAIGTVAWCWRKARLSVSRALLIAFAALCVLYPVTPFAAKGTGFIDQRLPPVASFLLFAGTLPIGLSRRQRRAVSVGMIAIISMRFVDIGSVWYRHADDIAAFRRVIAPIEPGARVLAVTVAAEDVSGFYEGQPRSRFFLFGHSAIMHLPALALIERRAFWPLLFTAPTKQPLKVLAPYSSIAVNEGMAPSYTWLSAGPGLKLPYDAPYLANWQSNFNYVIVLFAGKLPDAAKLRPNLLSPLVITDVAALYRITHAAPVP